MPLNLPPPAQSALLLDVDGTLLEFAPTPESVVVPPGLVADLRRLRAALGGALGVITGRPLEQVDALLGDAPAALAGEHGGALRRSPGGAVERPNLPEPPAEWFSHAEALAAAHPGALVERKRRGFVLHYRQAPEAGPALRTALTALMAPAGAAFQLLEAALAWEVRPAGMDKGVALRQLMERPPFAGRRPVYVGDDVTDLDAIAAADALGGAGLLVGPSFGDPAAVRTWLNRSAAALESGHPWPPLPLT